MFPSDDANDADPTAPDDPDVYRYEIDADERPSHAAVTVVAVLRDQNPTEMPPLGAQVDFDALDRLLASTGGGEQCTVTLTLGSHVLTFHGDETVVARPRAGPKRDSGGEGLSP